MPVGAPWPGANGVLYRNVSPPGVPFWFPVPNVRDVENPLTYSDNDVSSRTGGGFKQHEPGLGDLGLPLTMLYDMTDPNVAQFAASARAKTMVELAPMDAANNLGIIGGVLGFRACYKIFAWNRKEPIDGQMEVVIDFKPCYFPGFPPSLLNL